MTSSLGKETFQVKKDGHSRYGIEGMGAGIMASFSTREITRDQKEYFYRAHALQTENCHELKQVHGPQIITIHQSISKSSVIHEADGWITNQLGVGLVIRTADCLPVFFSDEKNGVIGLAHAGWRGLHQGILEAMVQKFIKDYGSQSAHIKAFLGPAMRSCCYEVGMEFKDYFPQSTEPAQTPQKLMMNMIQEARRRLQAQGISLQNLGDSGFCTGCRNDEFFSARKGASEERIFSLIVRR